MKKISLSLVLSAALLITSISGTTTSVHAETAMQAAGMIRAGLVDKQTGLSFFEWYPDQDSYPAAYIVIKNKEGHWFRLNNKLGMPQIRMNDTDDGVQEPEYQVAFKDSPTWYWWLGGPGYYYHLKDQVVYKGMSFYWSPDREYGYTIVNSPSAGNWRGYGLLVKEASSGEIKELIRSDGRWQGLYWLDGKRMIMCKYNRTADQNELLLLDASDGSVKHLAFGSLKGFDPERREVLFVYNEPARTRYIMEAASGKVRKAAEQELIHFNKEIGQANNRVSTDLNPSTLEEWNPPIVIRYEHELQIKEKKISLPFAVKRGGTLYIPVKPLLDGLGLQLGDKLGPAKNYRFPLLVADGKARTELTPSNSIVLVGQLFITRGVLQTLGYPDARVVAVKTEIASPAS